MQTVRKAIAQVLTAGVAWGGAVTVSRAAAITASEWVMLAGGVVGGVLVWLIPNEDREPSPVGYVGELDAP